MIHSTTGFSIYILSSFEDDGSNIDIVYQWKAIPDSGCSTENGPHMVVGIKYDKFVLRTNSDSNSCSSDSTLVEDQDDLGNIVKGRWNDFVVKIDWDYDQSGHVQIWRKTNTQGSYTTVLDRWGPNMRNDSIDGYVKWGIYKPSWNWHDGMPGATSVFDRQLWHDNVRVEDFANCNGSHSICFSRVDPT